MASLSSVPSWREPRPGDNTILVVDDDVLMLRLVEQTLRVEGYRVWTATRAADARRLRVLYISRYSREELLGRGIELSESQLLKKPFMPAQLLSRVREALSA